MQPKGRRADFSERVLGGELHLPQIHQQRGILAKAARREVGRQRIEPHRVQHVERLDLNPRVLLMERPEVLRQSAVHVHVSIGAEVVALSRFARVHRPQLRGSRGRRVVGKHCLVARGPIRYVAMVAGG